MLMLAAGALAAAGGLYLVLSMSHWQLGLAMLLGGVLLTGGTGTTKGRRR